MANSLILRILTYKRLGFLNIALAAYYRIQLKCNWFKVTLPVLKPITGDFFNGRLAPNIDANPPQDSNLLLEGRIRYFSHRLINVGSPPNWSTNPESGRSFPDKNHWSTIGDFSNGDIKLTWEASRFHWLILASQGRVSTKTMCILI